MNKFPLRSRKVFIKRDCAAFQRLEWKPNWKKSKHFDGILFSRGENNDGSRVWSSWKFAIKPTLFPASSWLFKIVKILCKILFHLTTSCAPSEHSTSSIMHNHNVAWRNGRKKRHNKNIKSQLTHSRFAFQVFRHNQVVEYKKISFLRNQHLAGMFYVFAWIENLNKRMEMITSFLLLPLECWNEFIFHLLSTWKFANEEFYWLSSS